MEEKEFRQKVMPLQRRMYAVALKLGLPPDDAADAVQETQLKLWRGREGIPEEPGALTAYCLVSLRNECISSLRKRKDRSPIEQAGQIIGEGGTENVEMRDTRHHIERLIDMLPEGQQRVLRLSSFGEFDVPEIAEATGYTPGNVRQLLSRGRKRLRELFIDH